MKVDLKQIKCYVYRYLPVGNCVLLNLVGITFRASTCLCVGLRIPNNLKVDQKYYSRYDIV